MGGKDVLIDVEIIDSDIPLLMSKAAMKKANMVLYLSEDSAEVFGKKMPLNTTTAGHYVIPLLARETGSFSSIDSIDVDDIFSVNLLEADDKDKYEALDKLHKQFGHRPKDSFINLLKSANSWSEDMRCKIEKIIDSCEGCIKRKRNPDRPAVSFPMANEFNEMIAIDLSVYKGKYILHIVDMWSRLTVSTVIARKKPSEVIDKIMQKWIAHYGVMQAILNDNGGEFTSEEMREVKAILDVRDLTTAAESPWQNGICEKNHALVDNILERLDDDYPEMDLDVKLAWAGMAKNSLQMVYGYSPNQLVFGQNPKLPNIITGGPPTWEISTTSEVLAKHLNCLHAARRAFISTENSERLKTALKAKICTSSEIYENGDIVYYKRSQDNRWMGPGKVVFQDGKIIFVRNGATFVRVSANRITKAGKELAKSILIKEGEQNAGDCTSYNHKISTYELEQAEDVNMPEEQVSNPDVENLPDTSSTSVPASTVQTSPTSAPASNVKKTGSKIELKNHERIKFHDGKDWVEATITGRGKITGQYRNWFNVKRHDGKEDHSVNLEEISYEKVSERVNDVLLTLVPRDEHNTKESIEAKLAELARLKEFETYKVIPDEGQDRISCTWVLCKKASGLKARLVARGFEEIEDVPSDSPTMSKSTLRIILSVAALKDWTIETTDIKCAFLQGSPLERTLVLKQTKEAENTGNLWLLQKALYGLKDASRQWFFKVKAC